MKLAKSLATLATGICILSSPSFAKEYQTENLPIYKQIFSMWVTRKFDYCFTYNTPTNAELQKLRMENQYEFYRFNKLIDTKEDHIISIPELEAFKISHCSRAFRKK